MNTNEAFEVTQDDLALARDTMLRSDYPIWPAEAQRLIAEVIAQTRIASVAAAKTDGAAHDR